MNLQHLKYIVEVERVGSITKAASNLFMGQPNLSKAIKEVESEIGIQIFNRSAKGVFPTEKGAVFLEHAHAVLVQLDKIQELYKPETENRITFSISVPRASYITSAFAEFVRKLDKDKPVAIDFKETNSVEAVENVAAGIHNIAIIRYEKTYEEFFLSLLSEKNLIYEPVLEFEYRLLMSAENPQADADDVPLAALADMTEIVHGDLTIPYLSASYTKKNDGSASRRRIYVYERGSQLDLLRNVSSTYMWVSPMPLELLETGRLVQKTCSEATKRYNDVLVYPSSYSFTDADNDFLAELYSVRDSIASGSDRPAPKGR